VVRREGERGARRREAEVRVVEREARLERLRRTARRRLGVHIMPHVPDRYAFPTKVTQSFISFDAAYKWNKIFSEYTDKKENLLFLIYKEIQKGSVQSQRYMTNGLLIYCMVKYLLISSYIRKPFLIYDFATAPV
jgi:hypothetical protein